MFENAFQGSGYEVRNIVELGPARQDAHYTHSIDAFFREGGGSPPIWARASGAESVLLGMTFVDEMLGIFVRADDSAMTVAELAGRRVALPVWPRLVFNFWRFVALHAISATLQLNGMRQEDVRFIEVVEEWDPSERRNIARGSVDAPARCEYRRQLDALLEGKVDAVFGKGYEAALLVHEARGRIRMLSDLRDAPASTDRVRISMPRLLTTSVKFLEKHPDAVVRYLRTLVQAAHWADDNIAEASALVARECGVAPWQQEGYVGPEFVGRFLPRITDEMLESTQFMVTFLHRHGFIPTKFAVESWLDPAPLAEALAATGTK
jgi:sulfonate transport system substrate-binding protein